MTYGVIPDAVKEHPRIKELPTDQQQLIWELSNDLCLNYLMTGNCDPVVNLLSKMEIGSELLDDLYRAESEKELFKKYYMVPDLLMYRDMLTQLKLYDKTADTPEFKAFYNLILYLMHQMSKDPWWFSRVGFWNRYLGSRMRDEAYVALRFNMSFVPNHFINVHSVSDIERMAINKATRPIEEVYGWVDPEQDTNDEVKNDQ